jgi:hypothetical protein
MGGLFGEPEIAVRNGPGATNPDGIDIGQPHKPPRLKFGRIAELNAEPIGIFHVEALGALFVRLGTDATGLQVTNDRLSVEFIDSQAKVVDVPGGFLLPKCEMARANP